MFEEWEELEWSKIKTPEQECELLNQLLISELMDRYNLKYDSVTLRTNLLGKYKDIISDLFHQRSFTQVFVNEGGPLCPEFVEMVMLHKHINTILFKVNNSDHKPTLLPPNTKISILEFRIDEILTKDNSNIVIDTIRNSPLLVLEINFGNAMNGDLSVDPYFGSKLKDLLKIQRIETLKTNVKYANFVLNAQCRTLILNGTLPLPEIQELIIALGKNTNLSTIELESEYSSTEINGFLENLNNLQGFTLNKVKVKFSQIERNVEPIQIRTDSSLISMEIQADGFGIKRIVSQPPQIREGVKKLLLLARRIWLLRTKLTRDVIGLIGASLYTKLLPPEYYYIWGRIFNSKSLGKIRSPYKFGTTELVRQCLSNSSYKDSKIKSIKIGLKQKMLLFDGDSDEDDDFDRYEEDSDSNFSD